MSIEKRDSTPKAKPPTISVTPAEPIELPVRPLDPPKADSDTVTDLDKLDDLLRGNLIEHLDGYEKNFLTVHCLRRLLPPATVKRRLFGLVEDAKAQGYRPRNPDINNYIELICHDGSSPDGATAPREKSCIRLFATLILTDKELDIFKFIDEDICDDALPISEYDVSSIINWPRIRYRDDFTAWQRRVNVPFLAHGQHQVFDQRDVLPFIRGSKQQNLSLEEPGRLSPQAEAGGYGEVSYVEIHHDCHNFHDVFGSLPKPTGPFARKKLLHTRSHRTGEDFRREADMLKKFDGGVHRHIVTVLTTYQHGDDYYLLFPWAECDLARYCEINPNPTRNLDTIQWLVKQCLKIMEAVDLIHDPPGVDSLQVNDKLYGRHGDIKAENILVFRSKKGKPHLVLSDFGLSSMHHDWSKSDVPNKSISATPCFRPPECDMEGAVITRSFDVWNLGCLFLDLLTWLLGGEKLRQEFETARMAPYLNNINIETPIYFEVVTTDNDESGYIVKEQVKQWFAKMHCHQHCTKLVHEFLSMIEERMLIVETEGRKRSRTKDLLKDLNTFNQNCKGANAKAYCLDEAPYKPSSKINTPIIAEGRLSVQAQNYLHKSGAKLRRLTGPTEKAEQARQGDEQVINLRP